MRITGLNHITLAVSDLAQSQAFYVDVLGAVLRASWARGAYLELGSIWLCLAQSNAGVPSRTDDTHLAFSCPSSDFSAFSQKIAAGAQIWKKNTSEGASVYFLDPDGHRLELHQGDLDSRLAHYLAHPEKAVVVHEV